MNTEFIMKDLATGEIGRYRYTFSHQAELLQLINLDMLLTIEEMADVVIGEVTDRDKEDIMKLEKDELIHLHASAGGDIRNAFGLWLDGNPNVKVHPDDTSMTVLELVWKILRRNSNNIFGSTVMKFT